MKRSVAGHYIFAEDALELSNKIFKNFTQHKELSVILLGWFSLFLLFLLCLYCYEREDKGTETETVTVTVMVSVTGVASEWRLGGKLGGKWLERGLQSGR